MNNRPGLGNAGSYLVSGIPYVSPLITVPHSGATVHTLSFNLAPRRVTIKNTLASIATNQQLMFGLDLTIKNTLFWQNHLKIFLIVFIIM